MKIFDGLKLHPNGFLGAPLEYKSAHPKKPITVDLIGTASRTIKLESDDNTVNPNYLIQELFVEASTHEQLIAESFEFRERIYLAALKAFGTTTIQQWILKQKSCPYFDHMQNRFVEETVDYVFSGNRKYHPMVYLDTMHIGKHNAFSIGPSTRRYLFEDTRRQTPVVEFLQKWLGQTNGMSDMIFSLRAMFGA